METALTARAADPAQLLALLKSAELFSTLLDDDLAYVASRVGEKALAEGEALFAPGEKASRFWIMRSGEVVVTREEELGRSVALARYVGGDVIGDFDFVIGAAYDAAARATADTRLLVFPAEGRGLEELALEKPDTVSRILLRSLAMVSSRLRSVHLLISENAPWLRELKRQLYTDGPTGLWTKAFMEEEIGKELSGPTALIMLKPDRFKEMNDAHGHAAGDYAMARIAEILRDCAADLGEGWPVRIKSNETALVLPKCGEGEAFAMARALAERISLIDMRPACSGDAFRFTVSGAVALWAPGGPKWKELVEACYGQLVKAWRDGGDRLLRLDGGRA